MRLTHRRRLEPRKRRVTDEIMALSHFSHFVKEQLWRYGKVAYLIRHLRQSHQLTQFELAEQLGVTQSAVSKLEAGKILPTSALRAKLAAIFELSTETFT